MPNSLLPLLLLLLAIPSTHADFRVTTDTSAEYPNISPVSGLTFANSKCGKVANRSGAGGTPMQWRPLNTNNSAAWWQTINAPRSLYGATPEEVDPDVWTFLQGHTQMVARLKNRLGREVSYFVALRCVVAIDRERDDENPYTAGRNLTTGFVLTSDETPTILAIEQPMPEIHGLPVTPVMLGMTAGLNFPVDNDTPWEDISKTNLTSPALVEDFNVWIRTLRPPVRTVNGSSWDKVLFDRMSQTRHYTEEQCRAWLRYFEEIQDAERRGDQFGITGVFTGTNVCDIPAITLKLTGNVLRQTSPSRNSPTEPLSVPEGLFLVIIPALWELTLAMLLLTMRILKRKDVAAGPYLRHVRWLVFELITLSVALGEFGLLVTSTIEQSKEQLCQIGRRGMGQDLLSDGVDLAYFGSTEGISNVHSDALMIECYEDPGTNLKWAIIIGVVAFLHVAVLAFEMTLLSSRQVREKSYSGFHSVAARWRRVRSRGVRDEASEASARESQESHTSTLPF